MRRTRLAGTVLAGLFLLIAAPATAQEPPKEEPLTVEEPVSSEDRAPDQPDYAAYIVGQSFSGGDGDDVPEPGERLEMTIEVANGGAKPLTGLTLNAVGATEGVTIISGTATFPDIPVNRTATAQQPVAIELSSSVPMNTYDCGGSMGAPVIVEDGAEPVEDSSNDDVDAPQPESYEPEGDPAASFEIELAATAGGGYSDSLALSTMVVCAMAEAGPADGGVGVDVADGPTALGDDTTKTASSGSAARTAGIIGGLAAVGGVSTVLMRRRRGTA